LSGDNSRKRSAAARRQKRAELLGTSLLHLLVDEVAAGAIGTVASDPVLLAQLRLVLRVAHHVLPQLVFAVGELTKPPVHAGALLLEVPADLGLEPRVGGWQRQGLLLQLQLSLLQQQLPSQLAG